MTTLRSFRSGLRRSRLFHAPPWPELSLTLSTEIPPSSHKPSIYPTMTTRPPYRSESHLLRRSRAPPSSTFWCTSRHTRLKIGVTQKSDGQPGTKRPPGQHQSLLPETNAKADAIQDVVMTKADDPGCLPSPTSTSSMRTTKPASASNAEDDDDDRYYVKVLPISSHPASVRPSCASTSARPTQVCWFACAQNPEPLCPFLHRTDWYTTILQSATTSTSRKPDQLYRHFGLQSHPCLCVVLLGRLLHGAP